MANDLIFISDILLVIVFIAYFIGFMLYLIAFTNRYEKLSSYTRILVIITFFLHLFSILCSGISLGHFPLTKLYETLSFFAFAMIALFIMIDYLYNLSLIGLIILPLSFVFVGFALLIPKSTSPLPPVLQSHLFEVHIIIAFLSYASFVIAFVTGIIYLYQEKQIKSKSKSIWHYRLPSLQVLDEVNYRAVTFGFPLFTLSLIIGIIWAQQAWGAYWSWDPKQTSALATWIFYAGVLHGRLASGWRGKKTAILSIIGFLFILFTYIGLHYLGLGAHNYN